MAKYNGYPSWNAWNVCLWIDNEYGLYRECVNFAKFCGNGEITKTEAIDAIHAMVDAWFKGKTPDKAIINKRACKIWLDNFLEDYIPNLTKCRYVYDAKTGELTTQLC